MGELPTEITIHHNRTVDIRDRSHSFFLTACAVCGDWITKRKGVVNASKTCGAWCKKQFHDSYNNKRTAAAVKANSEIWHLKDQRGVDHHFKNLSMWVKENAHLFEPEDLTPRKHSKQLTCKAVGGLEKLSPRKKHPNLSWHGWTWHLDYMPIPGPTG